jgi:hypothetical protein
MRVHRFAAVALVLLATGGAAPGPASDGAAPGSAADEYARTMAAVIDAVHRGHIKYAPQHKLVERAVRGLYGVAKEPVPAALAVNNSVAANCGAAKSWPCGSPACAGRWSRSPP